MALKPKKLLFRLILIGLLSGVLGCHSDGPTDLEMDGSPDTDSSSDGDADGDADGDTDSDSDSDSATDTEESFCPLGYIEELYEVPSPPNGLPPNLDDICVFEEDIAQSNTAATVQLDVNPDNFHFASGQITVADELLSNTVGMPQISVTDAFPEELTGFTVSDMAPSEDGFSFNIEFSSAGWLDQGETEVTIKAFIEILCGDASVETKIVESLTYLHFCDSADHPIWVSSGGECTVCGEVCEKIASPLPALRDEGPAALLGSPKAEIIPVAHYGRNLILFADQQGTKGPLSFLWKASSGKITSHDKAGVIWEVPKGPGPHLIQVAVKDATSATVATMSWRHKA